MPEAEGGSPPITYSLTSAVGLPSGMTFDSSTRQFGGHPDTSQPETEYTYRATDSAGATVSMTFTVTVKPVRPANVMSYGGHQKVTLTWDEPVDTGVDKWQVSVNNGNWRDLASVMEVIHSGSAKLMGVVTGLSNDTSYGIRLRAVAVEGSEAVESNPSNSVNGRPVANSAPTISIGNSRSTRRRRRLM